MLQPCELGFVLLTILEDLGSFWKILENLGRFSAIFIVRYIAYDIL